MNKVIVQLHTNLHTLRRYTWFFKNPLMKTDILGHRENLNKLKIIFIKTEPKRDF